MIAAVIRSNDAGRPAIQRFQPDICPVKLFRQVALKPAIILAILWSVMFLSPAARAQDAEMMVIRCKFIVGSIVGLWTFMLFDNTIRSIGAGPRGTAANANGCGEHFGRQHLHGAKPDLRCEQFDDSRMVAG